MSDREWEGGEEIMPSDKRTTLPSLARLSSSRTAVHKAKASDPPVIDLSGWAEWVTLPSSNIASVRYHNDDSQLEVRFRNGGVYRYGSVPLSVFSTFVQSGSPGRYLARSIRSRFLAYKVR